MEICHYPTLDGFPLSQNPLQALQHLHKRGLEGRCSQDALGRSRLSSAPGCNRLHLLQHELRSYVVEFRSEIENEQERILKK
jgi:hypothetical protein